MKITKTGRHGIQLPDYNLEFDGSGRTADHLFVTHAHMDHMPRSRTESRTWSTSTTLRLMRLRGFSGTVTGLQFGEAVELPNCRVTLYPAGHILGSAMVYVETEEGNLLYTGDYRSPPSPASEGFRLPDRVDYLVTEATFSLPVFRWPAPDELAEQVRSFATDSLAAGKTPLFIAYNLGKAQEIMHLLAPLKHPVQIHRDGHALCAVYEEEGIDLGRYEPYDPDTCEGKILIAPSSSLRGGFASGVERRVAYCSGWAVRESSRRQMKADALIPLSDHLDFFELIRICRELSPRRVWLTHTPNADVVRHYLDGHKIPSVHLNALPDA